LNEVELNDENNSLVSVIKAEPIESKYLRGKSIEP